MDFRAAIAAAIAAAILFGAMVAVRVASSRYLGRGVRGAFFLAVLSPICAVGGFADRAAVGHDDRSRRLSDCPELRVRRSMWFPAVAPSGGLVLARWINPTIKLASSLLRAKQFCR
jgi:hypothetical protein